MAQPTAAAQSLQFGTSVSDYVKFYPDMVNVKYALTVCSWVKKQQTGTDRWWINYSTTTHNHEIIISDGGRNYIRNDGFSVSVSVPLNTWTHQCQSWSTSSATLKVYYNGTLVGSERITNTSPLQEGGYIFLGHYSHHTDQFSYSRYVFGGQLMKLNIFGKELSGTEVAELYRGGRCSEVEKLKNARFITWENILSQPRTGNVREVDSGCQLSELSIKLFLLPYYIILINYFIFDFNTMGRLPNSLADQTSSLDKLVSILSICQLIACSSAFFKTSYT